MSKAAGRRGRLTSWKDDRGFGFITPKGGGDQVFAHISAFTDRNRRPEGNESVIFELKVDEEGRKQAARVWFADGRKAKAPAVTGSVSSTTLIVVGGFFALLGGMVFAGQLPFLVAGVYLFASALSFFLYGWDKTAARGDRWRTQERTLHTFDLFGGWPGALVAREVFRHKTKKRSFVVTFWSTVVLNCAALAWLSTSSGGAFLELVSSAIR